MALGAPFLPHKPGDDAVSKGSYQPHWDFLAKLDFFPVATRGIWLLI